MADTLPFSEKTSSGTSVLIQGVECGFINVPLHNIYLSSDLVTGLVAVGIKPYLHFKGVLLTSTLCVDQPSGPIEQEIPDLTLLVPSLGQWQRRPIRVMGCRVLT